MNPRRPPARTARTARSNRSGRTGRNTRPNRPMRGQRPGRSGSRHGLYLRPLVFGLLAGAGLFIWFNPWGSAPEPETAVARAPTLESLRLEPATSRKIRLPAPSTAPSAVRTPAPVARKIVAPDVPSASAPVSKTVNAPVGEHTVSTRIDLPLKPVVAGSVPGSSAKTASGPNAAGNGAAEPPVRPLPKGLAPRIRAPEVDLTFYRELPRREVVLPPEPEAAEKKTAVKAAVPPRPELPGRPSLLPERTVPAQLVKPAWYKAPRAENPAANWSSTAVPGVFEVQVGVFSDLGRASDLVEKLRQRGASPRVVTASGGRSTLHRVRLGPFPTREAADQALQRWKIPGQSALVLDNTPRPKLPPTLRPAPPVVSGSGFQPAPGR